MRTALSARLRSPSALLALALALALALVLVALGCEEKKPPLPSVDASATADAGVAAPGAVKLVIEGASSASLDLPAPKERIVATVSGGRGAIDVVPSDLVKSRGQVQLDLTTLATSTFKDKRDAEQTAHARTWLEVADGATGKLPDDVKEKNRYAVYTVKSIENASATDLAKVPATKDGGDDVRKVTLTTKGELLVHGRTVDRDADLEISFRYAPGAPAHRPNAASIATKKPLSVVLAEHDVKPRDTAGKLAKDFFHLLGTKVADNADVTLDLRAKLAP